MLVTGTYSKFLAPGLFKVFDNKYNEVPLIGDSFFNTETSDRKYLDSYGYLGFGNPEIVREGEEYPMTDTKPTPGKTVETTKYGLGYEITDELMRYDQYGVVRKLPEMLADSMKYFQDLLALDVFIRGQTTARTAADGQPLFSNAHVNETTGATASNLGTPAALSATSLQAALMSFRTARNAQGRTITTRPKYLVVAPALEFTARTLLGTAQVLGSNNNDINVLTQEGLQIIVWPALAESAVTQNAWFLLPEKGQHELFKWTQVPLDHVMWDEPKRDVVIHRSRYQLTYDFWDWRNVYANFGV